MKLSRFWKIYIFSVAAALLVLIVGLSVFYAFIASYEKSQPEYAASEYATTLTDNVFADILKEINMRSASEYETGEQLKKVLLDAFETLNGDFSVRKNYKKYSSDAPVFSLTKDSVTVADIYLESAENGLFGMKRWKIADLQILTANLIPAPEDYTFYAPSDAVLSVNGITLLPENKSDQVPYRFTSPYEPDSTASWDVYTVTRLFQKPNVTCSLNGDACSFEEKENTFLIKYPQTLTATYSLTVPNEALVTINGVTLKPEHITNASIPYEYSPLEATLSGLPYAVTYTISDLFHEPDLQGVLRGTSLEFTLEEDTYTAAYPQSMLYACTIRVPVGSEVFLRGMPCNEYFTEQMTGYDALSAHIKSLPMFDVYTLPALYISPADEITVMLNGESLAVRSETTDIFHIVSTSAFPKAENETVAEQALVFLRDYITYTGEGYKNLDTNLYRVLAHVIPNTETYLRIANSRIGIYYVTPVNHNDYKRQEITSITRYADDMYGCTVSFEVIQKTYYIQNGENACLENDFVGEMHLIYIHQNGVWKVADMQIDSK
ncbi:MAG: hypothetical protein IKB87_03255 [Clostridia bacterium]|nr:hypothetical protein [Clostridia bacterium]